MRFEFLLRESLPRLAWCAHLRRGCDVVEVQHGPWVETQTDVFVEGAWTGPFSGGGVVDAAHLVGTAGQAERDQVFFCSPNNLCDRIHSVHVGDDLYVSNSIAFLLQITGDGPDPLYTGYAVDRLTQQASGLRQVDKRLPTAAGRQIVLHDFCNIAVRADLSIRRAEKTAMPPPEDFAECVGQLEETIAAIQANAADSGRRRRRYRPIATVSRGYDSGALAVLMRRHGANEAITFRSPPEDDGTELAERLGYTVTGYDGLGFRHLPNMPEAEFHVTPWGYDVVTAVCEQQLVGAVLVTGRRGGRLFGTGAPGLPDLFYPRLSSLAGSMMVEFRLRVGFVHLAPYYVAALHPRAIHRISVSAEMKPWSVGGGYDRPIPRRILEEAGIPRDWFGWKKYAAARYLMLTPQDMTEESAVDFTAYVRTLPTVGWPRRSMHHGLVLLHELALRVNRLRRNLYGVIGQTAPSAAAGQHLKVLAPRLPFPMTFAFHWGCARTQSRYAVSSSPPGAEQR